MTCSKMQTGCTKCIIVECHPHQKHTVTSNVTVSNTTYHGYSVSYKHRQYDETSDGYKVHTHQMFTYTKFAGSLKTCYAAVHGMCGAQG